METFCFNIIKTKYFDFLFGNKLCCLKTDLNFREGVFKPELKNKKRPSLFLLRKILEFTHFLPFLDLTTNLKNPYSSTFLTVFTPVSSPAAKRKQCLHPTVYFCLSSTSLILLWKKGAAEMELFVCPKAWWHPGYV